MLKNLGLTSESIQIQKMARDSDVEYEALAKEMLQSLTGPSRQGYNEVDQDIGPMLQITSAKTDFIYEKMTFKPKAKIDDLELFVFRPLHPNLLAKYGLRRDQINNFILDFNDSFRWSQGFHSEFEVIDNSAKILIYPNLSDFQRLEQNISSLAPYSWMDILIKLDPKFEFYFNHEFSHFMNKIRGFHEENNEMSDKEYANSNDEIKSRVIELLSHVKSDFKKGEPSLVKFIESGDHQGFIDYVLYKYSDITLPASSTKETLNIYKMRLADLYLILKETN